MRSFLATIRRWFWAAHRRLWCECLDFFEESAGDADFVKKLQKQTRNIMWEAQSASRYSPGIVRQDEKLYRQVVDPIHVDTAMDQLKPTAFDDASSKGLSVDRLAYRARGDVVSEGRDRAAAAARQPRSLYALATLVAGEVRKIAFEGKRAFGVYDTALANNRAHSDICQLVSGSQAGRSVRSRLLDLAQPTLEVLVNK